MRFGCLLILALAVAPAHGCGGESDNGAGGAGGGASGGQTGGGEAGGTGGGATGGGGQAGSGGQTGGGEAAGGSTGGAGGGLEPFVEIGTGVRRYEPLEDGQTVPIIEGIQGGHHIWGGFRGDGFNPEDIEIAYALTMDGMAVGGVTYVDYVERGASGFYEYSAVSVFIDDETDPLLLDGVTLRMSMRITDVDGLVLEDDIELVAACCE
jgi:hypothetical protein